MLIFLSFNLGVLGAAVRECLLQGPEVIKGALLHHLHRPAQLHLANAGQLIQIKPWCMSFWSNKIQRANRSSFSSSVLLVDSRNLCDCDVDFHPEMETV